MKKTLYYISPFIILPIIISAFTLLDKTGIISANVMIIFTCITLFLFSAVVGNLSSANRNFDYIMTAIIPLSFFLALFIALFFDEGCDGKPQFLINHALNMEYYKPWLPIVLSMAIVTFVASFKPIRVLKKYSHIYKSNTFDD